MIEKVEIRIYGDEKVLAHNDVTERLCKDLQEVRAFAVCNGRAPFSNLRKKD